MSARAIRRAAERLALKSVRPGAVSETQVSPAQLAANRENAQLSCGPKTDLGKLISSHNAVKTGLTGRTILLPTDDVPAYQSLVALINQKFTPATDFEKHLTQTIADTEWRLLRIPTLEAGLYALGRIELAAECPDPTALEALIFRTYQKDLRNLALQERRLRNQLKADTAELRAIQQARLEAQTTTAENDPPPLQPAPSTPENGFEFSSPDVPVPQPPQPDAANQKSEAMAA